MAAPPAAREAPALLARHLPCALRALAACSRAAHGTQPEQQQQQQQWPAHELQQWAPWPWQQRPGQRRRPRGVSAGSPPPPPWATGRAGCGRQFTTTVSVGPYRLDPVHALTGAAPGDAAAASAAAASPAGGRRRVVAVALSGGVDSAVAALLLRRAGFEIFGVFMRNWDAADEAGRGAPACSGAADAADAAAVAAALGIELHEADFVAPYWTSVFEGFLAGLERGLTPNPDLACNAAIKFGALLHHEQLAHAVFPVGHLTKPVVRRLAAAAGLPSAGRRSSAGICFIGRRSFGRFVEAYLPPAPGTYVDVDSGRALGRCANMLALTVGQRAAGLGGQAGRVYVAGKDLVAGVVHVAAGHGHPALASGAALLRAPSWVSGVPPAGAGAGGAVACQFRARYRQASAGCTLRPLAAGEAFAASRFCGGARDAPPAGEQLWVAELAAPMRGLTPGQAFVAYAGEPAPGAAAEMGSLKQRFKAVDFYKKIPADLTEATLTGSVVSLAAAVIMVLLLILELASFLRLQTTTEMVIDKSPQNELLKVTFNISFPALSCEFATIDVSDALGKKRMNLSRTISKTPVDVALQVQGPTQLQPTTTTAPRYDDEDMWWEHLDYSQPINHENFKTTLAHYPIVVVNFYAPWCHWCQRLEPAWEAATKEVHEKYPDTTDRRIRFAKVDCTAEVDLCQSHFITGFPSLRVFRRSHDDIYIEGRHEHEAYTGDRTKEALVAFADSLVPSAGQPFVRHSQLEGAPHVSGCQVAGFVLVKKVPGTLHFTARSEGHSFDHDWMNMTHAVHELYFGAKPTPHKLYELKKLHPLGLSADWLDKLAGQSFVSDSPQSTHEHYMQVVRTTIVPRGGGRGGGYDAYEYNAHSHTYHSDNQPTAKFTYDLSPIQVVVREVRRPFYKFATTTCAVVGGVFTVAGILDAMLHTTLSARRKIELGKHG
ncbi:PDIL5-4 [Scenedesmus sp. PABB004]|nr:PDIL5-4 [Scenedesmus sp. PABB004]